MRGWLSGGVANLTEESEGFLLGRGLPSPYIDDLGIGLWSPPGSPSPDKGFKDRYGGSGEGVRGWLAIPLYAPQGRLVGMTYRRWKGNKEVMKFHLSDAGSVPVFEGMTSTSLDKIWKGGDIWLVEGIFDMALAHIVPPLDAVLSCGTARLSRRQLQFLQRFLGRGARVHLAFDEDATGRKQAREAQSTLYKVGVNSRWVRYRGGKDPGEIWERGGRDALRTAFKL